MRADRLVALLLLLQRRGRVTVAEIADELEVSERTARRDLEALGMAGMSVYSTPGRGGGWQLAGDGRTDLSGLNEQEAHALFLVAGPSADATPELKAALRKLVRALPEPLRDSAERAGRAIVVDPVSWDGRGRVGRDRPAVLADVQDALLRERRIRLTYVDRTGEASERLVDPWGLVAKGSRWYLVAGTERGQRTFRLDRVVGVEPTHEAASLPADFDLDAAWAEISDRVGDLRMPLRVEARVASAARWSAMHRFGDRLRVLEAATTPDGWWRVELRGHGARELASIVAGFGASVVVDDPHVRSELRVIAEELRSTYGADPDT